VKSTDLPPFDHSAELRVAARSLAVALTRYERTLAGDHLDNFRTAKEDLISSARCVVLAESALEAFERLEAAEDAAP
jgi:hypothetical protein